MSALTRYSAVTPKRPEATCLIAERLLSPLGTGLKRSDFLAAFAGVRLAADAVHRDGQRRVRLARDRAKRHGAGGETLHDLASRARPPPAGPARGRLLGALDAEQAAQIEQVLVLLVQQLGEGAILVARIAAHGVLQQRDGVAASSYAPRRGCGRRNRRRHRARRDRPARRRRRAGGGARSRAAISFRPTPSTRVVVPVKYSSTKLCARPTASKICAPQ